MTRQTESPVQSDGNQTPGQVGRASRYGTRPKRGRKPGRRPGPINPEPIETNEPPGSDTEDSADRLDKSVVMDNPKISFQRIGRGRANGEFDRATEESIC